jgi:hypothetical protein
MPHPMNRKEDLSALGRVNWYLETYRPLALIVYGLLLLFGAKMVWPRDTIAAHEKRITILEARADTAAANSAILVRLRCFDKDVSAAERELAGLDCSKMYQAKAADAAGRGGQ